MVVAYCILVKSSV